MSGIVFLLTIRKLTLNRRGNQLFKDKTIPIQANSLTDRHLDNVLTQQGVIKTSSNIIRSVALGQLSSEVIKLHNG